MGALCRSLGVSRSWLYEAGARPADPGPGEGDTRLRDAVERLCLAFPGYGYRRVTAQLRRDGWAVNAKRVLRVMRDESLLCRLRKAFRPPASGSAREAPPDLLKGVDAFSRRCVGWHLSEDIDTRLTLAALERALAARRPAPGLGTGASSTPAPTTSPGSGRPGCGSA